MTNHKAEATYHNPPRKLAPETLGRMLFYAFHPSGRWDALTFDATTEHVMAAVTLLNMPGMQAHNAAVWREGHKSCVCDRPGGTPCRNPYGDAS